MDAILTSDFFVLASAISALSVVAVQQILKLKFIPVSFANKHPVPTNIVLSIIAACIAFFVNGVFPSTWYGWVISVAVIAVSAAFVYNNTLRNWTELRETEGTN